MYQLGDPWWSEPAPVTAPAASSSGSIWGSLASGIRDIAPALTQAYRERMILKTQLSRAQQGLPALDMTQYSPPMRIDTTVGPSSDMKQLMLVAGVAGLALGGLWLLGGKRRR